ncbi:MAG: transposase [Nitrospira sp.]|nr:transposase [Nitrospira sp.]
MNHKRVERIWRQEGLRGKERGRESFLDVMFFCSPAGSSRHGEVEPDGLSDISGSISWSPSCQTYYDAVPIFANWD